MSGPDRSLRHRLRAPLDLDRAFKSDFGRGDCHRSVVRDAGLGFSTPEIGGPFPSRRIGSLETTLYSVPLCSIVPPVTGHMLITPPLKST